MITDDLLRLPLDHPARRRATSSVPPCWKCGADQNNRPRSEGLYPSVASPPSVAEQAAAHLHTAQHPPAPAPARKARSIVRPGEVLVRRGTYNFFYDARGGHRTELAED